MATPATLHVELGLAAESGSFILDASLLDGTDTLGGDLGYVWTDITDWVHAQASITRGSVSSSGPYMRYGGGRCSFTLDSMDGRFDPTNLTGPYVAAGVSQLRPGVPVRIVARTGAVDTVLFVGAADDWPITFAGELNAIVEITASDPLETLNAADLPAVTPVGAGETAAARVDRILNRIEWPAAQREISPLASMALQETTLAQSAWTQILQAADSAGAYAWIDCTGRVVVRHQLGFPSAPQTVVGMTEGAIPFEGVRPQPSPLARVINTVNLGRAGSTAQFLEDLDSIALYGRRSWGRTDLTTANDEDVMALASQIVGQFAGLSAWHVSLVELSLDEHAATWSEALARDIGDRIEVRQVTPDGRTITAQGIIASVSWTWSPAVARYRVTWGLFPIPVDYVPFILDASLLDVDELAA